MDGGLFLQMHSEQGPQSRLVYARDISLVLRNQFGIWICALDCGALYNAGCKVQRGLMLYYLCSLRV